MKEKKLFYTEAAYFVGLITLAFGTALMERANFGMSMIVAPAYLVHLKMSQIYDWFSFGMAEYCLQAVLIMITALALRKFKVMYLLSFVTAVVYGVILDLMMKWVSFIPGEGLGLRVLFYLLGMVICAVGVSMLFHTYFAPEAYELLVKEIAAKFHFNIHKTKTVYDCTSCAVAVIMSFLFFGFGHFEGVKAGTILCALVNGWLIGRCSYLSEKYFDFQDARK